MMGNKRKFLWGFVALGLLWGNVTFAQEKVEETPKLSLWNRWSVGVGYTSGIGHFSDILMLSPDSWRAFYWDNLLEINSQYYLSQNWRTELGIGYLWSKWGLRMSNLNFKALGEFSAARISPSLLYIKTLGKGHILIGIGIDCHFTKKVGRKSWGKEAGIFLSLIPIRREITSALKYDISMAIRYGIAKDYRIATERDPLIESYVAEVYLKIGIYHNFSNKVRKRG